MIFSLTEFKIIMLFSGLKKLYGLFQLFIHKYTESKNNESKKVHRKNKPKMYQTQSPYLEQHHQKLQQRAITSYNNAQSLAATTRNH